MSTFSRKGFDPGLNKTLKWLSDWCGDLDDISVQSISISCRRYMEHELLENSAYRRALVGKQTPLHSFTKYVAYEWLHDQRSSKDSEKPRFEARMYFPDEALVDEVVVMGSSFDIRRAQVIEVGNREAIGMYGDIIIVDVYGNDTSIEVGFTRPYNLFRPLLEGLTNQAIWVPFPADSQPEQFEVTSNTYTEFPAYKITLVNECER